MAAERSATELKRFRAERADHLLRTAVLLTGSREAGEDLLQTAVERLFRRWRRFDRDPEGYLRRTLCNLATDSHRRESLAAEGAPAAPAFGLPAAAPFGLGACRPVVAGVPALFQPGLPSLGFGAPPGLGFGANALPTARALRAAISCGALAEAGRQLVDGIEAIKLTSRANSPISETIWVSPGTYLPVRVIVRSDLGFAGIRQTADITWLPPTTQNLARLTVPIPAGDRKVSVLKAVAPILNKLQPGAS